LNVKNGVIREALIEVVGCSGMTQSAAMAAEILPGRSLIEALNTDLVCDAINVAMREIFLQLVYGRSQTAFSKGGLPVGAGLEDLGKNMRSLLGTSYGSAENGPRYLECAEGYITKLGLDGKDRIIGYEYVDLGRMMSLITKDGIEPAQALEASTGIYGRFAEAVKTINPREE
jgi:NifU-like protein involved in Fe-S cluster formation